MNLIHSRISMGRLCLSALIAPLTIPILITLAAYVTDAIGGHHPVSWTWDPSMTAIVIVVVMVAVLAMFALGLPLAFALRQGGRLTALNVSLGAVCIGGFSCVTAIELLLSHLADMRGTVVGFAVGGGVGLCVGLVFCLVGGVPFRVRRDRSLRRDAWLRSR